MLIALRVAAAFVWPTINDVRTGATPEYPDLRPQRFNSTWLGTFGAALAVAKDMGLEITVQSPTQGQIQAVATTRVLRFKDDVTITIGREGQAIIVNVHSRSRVGQGDLGANARRIRDFQARLAAKMAEPASSKQ